ncbi:hypothetical protein I545_1116 [Mycobacterium kansasii 662]|uniref:Uncharacterized protein n=2 Tax=Mycobacterium kansasii TaxID=1768 RepID=A0A1V3XU42_MYCKA|nr:hypothetical protein I547_0121 [Mycobacterium kansasii 824]EUA21979.1 hypothetical protein I545_1116 [Mycobacterium kansasii 662]OOK82757.1 hypothetical protein BZL30_0472 [Mycobacterium kansasii]
MITGMPDCEFRSGTDGKKQRQAIQQTATECRIGCHLRTIDKA